MTVQTNERLGTVLSGAMTDSDGRLIVVGPNGSPLAGGVDPNATAVNNSSGNVANAVAAASIPAVAGKTSYLTGFELTGGGATAGSIIDVTVTGPGQVQHYEVAIPAGAGTQVQFQVEFTQPLQASAPNTAITVSAPAFGAGNTNAAVNVHGFQL